MTDPGRRLQAAARRLAGHQTTRVLLAAALRGAGIAGAALGGLIIADHFATLPAFVRAAGFAAVIATPLVLVAHALFGRLPALRDPDEAARRTETESEALRERLLPALQVLRVREDERTGYSTELVDAFVDDTVERVEAVRPETLPYNARVRGGLRTLAAGAAVVAVAVLLLGPAGARDALVRLATSYDDLGPKPLPVFAVTPGDASIPRGEAISLVARVDHVRERDGRVLGRLEWRVRPEDPWRTVALESPLGDSPVAGGAGNAAQGDGATIPSARFEHRFDSVGESFGYRFAHGDAASPVHQVKAVPRPTLTIEEVRYRYPEYTGLPERTVRDGAGDLAAVTGTIARLVVRSTNEPERASLALASGDTLDLARRGDGLLEIDVPILVEDSYRLAVVDTLGLTNPNPLEYRIRALSDEAPFIRLLEPGEDVDLDESMRVGLRWSAVDDYGLGPVELVWEVSRRPGEIVRRVIHAPESRVAEISRDLDWSLADLDLLPGDTVLYHLEVTDNDAVGGPHAARTREYAVRFPTLGEIYAEIDEDSKSDIEKLEEVVDDAKKVEERIEELSRELLKQGESTWENRQEVEQALEAQQQLAEELEQLRREIESHMQSLSESEFATLEAMEKMQKISELLDEVMTREMREALERLREALDETNPRRMEEDLTEYREEQKELMEQLDRVIRNLEQFRLEEKMKAAVRQAEELAARQERVNDELAKLDEDRAEDEGKEGDEGEEADEGEGEEGDESDEGAEGDDSESDAESDEGDDGAEAEPGDDDPSADDADPSEGDDAEAGEKSDEASDEGAESEGEKSDAGEESDEAGESAESGEKPDSSSDESSDEAATDEEKREKMESLAREEEKLAEEARRLEQEIEEIAEMTQELRDSQDSQSMKELSEQADRADIPEKMDEMADSMESGETPQAQEQGEKALTELENLMQMLAQQQQSMAQHFVQVNQAAINRAVRDLLTVSGDEESLAGDLASIPRNSVSATRSFADEQFLLIQGTERVESMLTEVAKDTPLMDSAVGRKLDEGLGAMRESAHGLENGAVHLARDGSEQAVEELNAVVIALLQTMKSMSSCSSSMPMSDLLQQLQEMTGDQQKLNDALKKLMKEGGSSMDHRLQAQMKKLGEEQRRIQEQLQQLMEEIGEGNGTLGRLDDVTKKLDEIADRLARGDIDEEALREQDWALTRLLDAQRSMRERDFGKQRKSETAEEFGEAPPPSELPEGLEELDRDLREDLLKALERRYPPKYEELIKRYFRSLSDEAPAPDLP